MREKCFSIPGTKGFDGKYVDGIHMRGILAVQHYTDSFIRMLRLSVTNSQAGRGHNRSDYHTRCPQTVYQPNRGQYSQHQRWGNTQGGYRTLTHRGFNRKNVQNSHLGNLKPGYTQNENVSSYGQNVYTIPVNNRFPENF